MYLLPIDVINTEDHYMEDCKLFILKGTDIHGTFEDVTDMYVIRY